MPEPNEFKRHLVFSGRTTSERYTSPLSGGGEFGIKQRNPSEHGQVIKEKLVEIKDRQNNLQQSPPPEGFIREDIVYLDFLSDLNFELAFDSFEDNRSGNYHLLSSLKEENNQYRALVAVKSKGLSALIKKVEAYSTKFTKKGNPQHAKLISNISDIRLASLRSFWNEPTIEFPSAQDIIWWEIWLRRENFQTDENEDQKVITQLTAAGANIGNRRLIMPEHIIRLVKGTYEQLSSSLLLLDNLAEIRKAKDTAQFFTDLRNFEQMDWVNDLLARIQTQQDDQPISICILDTGVNNGHPLINPFLPSTRMDSINPAWGNSDGHHSGHGTQMAGLALYGDLTEALSAQHAIQVFHQLESVKLINASAPHDPDIYGQVTIECVNRAIVLNPTGKRIFCMAITSEDDRDQGKPSSWSSAVDKIIFGTSGVSEDKNLLMISVGNVVHDNPSEYPAKNKLEFIHDPAQSFNCLSIGGYTEKDTIDAVEFPSSAPLAQRGYIAPSSSTSCLSASQWPIKPDIVMEAGNYGVQNNSIIYPASLHLLTTAKDFERNHFADFRDTSAATALASNFMAKIYQLYKELWLESIRGIVIHSARWTTQMLGGRTLNALNSNEKKDLLRTFGYGVPDLNKALYSLKNSLTLVAQRTIQPYRMESGSVKTNELHIFDLPWPEEALTALAAQQVKLTVTLSYFIEPNPGHRYFSSKFYYQSHGLRFKIKRPTESLREFKVRINKLSRIENDEVTLVAQNDGWQIGERIRNSGSVHKDIWIGTGADLAAMKNIAVYPVNGWWRLRNKLKKYDEKVRYSLIITIESDSTAIDLYTPVENLVAITV